MELSRIILIVMVHFTTLSGLSLEQARNDIDLVLDELKRSDASDFKSNDKKQLDFDNEQNESKLANHPVGKIAKKTIWRSAFL